MAKVEDLVAQIPDPLLREAIGAEIKALKKKKKFGLVFEEHLPERIRLPKVAVGPGEIVSLKKAPKNDLFRVRSIARKIAICEPLERPTESVEINVAELVAVRTLGDSIFPALIPIDRVVAGGADRPAHVLINADNFHALQLLTYCYEGQVDVIYIDPPYNTGARDWKYNNDFVDNNDSFRHSKWLSMMKKRLLLAKRLLKRDGVLIITIDEHEVHNLGALLEDMFPEMPKQMVTIVINQKGVAQGRLSRVEEYAFFCFGPDAQVLPQNDDLLAPDRSDQKRFSTPRWEWLLRGGTNSKREDRKQLFFPVYVDPAGPKITGFGDPLPFDQQPKLATTDEKKVAWPFRSDGSLGNWRVSPPTLRELHAKGYVKLGGYDAKRKTWTILYLGQKAQQQIEGGAIKISGRSEASGEVSVEFSSGEQRQLKTVWHRGAHDSGIYGSSLLRSMLPEGSSFTFPKSLYAVSDALRTVTAGKPEALVVDFFGGSGTTLHATALLNAEDGGRRRCILVTNNEVEEKAAKRLAEAGHLPGDPEFEKHGIAEAVTWPRVKAAITGNRVDGRTVEGEYLDGRPMSEGFVENAEFFRLDLLGPDEIARGEAFAPILPILWMMTGCVAPLEAASASKTWYIAQHAGFAVLLKEKEFPAFKKAISGREDVRRVFLVTDSEDNFELMRRGFSPKLKCFQLYKNYLDNFRINTPELLGEPAAS